MSLKCGLLNTVFDFYIKNNLFAPLDADKIKFELGRLLVENISFDFGLEVNLNNLGGISIKGWATDYPEYVIEVGCTSVDVKDI